jgi:hypothetical protein
MIPFDPGKLVRPYLAGALALLLLADGGVLLARGSHAGKGPVRSGAQGGVHSTPTARPRGTQTSKPRGSATPTPRGTGTGRAHGRGDCRPHTDFNGDGYDDIAVGAPGESFSNQTRAGAVNVVYGGAAGLSARGNQFLREGADRLPAKPNKEDEFGSAVAAGDFDGDGTTDLAVGAPNEDLAPPYSQGKRANGGAVFVVYGKRSGLDPHDNQVWTQDAPGIPETAEIADRFGTALTTADFNADGYADLAVGVPYEDLTDIGATKNLGFAGAVNVIYGSARGLSAGGAQLWTQDVAGVAGTGAESDLFGWSIGAGDLDGDGACDLVVGVPGEDVQGNVNAGEIEAVYGSARAGLVAQRSAEFSEGTAGVPGDPRPDDQLGYRVTAGDFNHDRRDDVAADVFAKDIGDQVDAGAVNVLYSDARGLNGARAQLWTQDSPGVDDHAERSDTFGFSLAAGDFNRDGFDDLAIGVPYERIERNQLAGGNIEAAGGVQLLPGTARGVTGTDSRLIQQGSGGVAGEARARGLVGWSARAADVDGDGTTDLMAGALSESYTASTDGAGAVLSLPRALGKGSKLWRQGTGGIKDSAEPNDNFGGALT